MSDAATQMTDEMRGKVVRLMQRREGITEEEANKAAAADTVGHNWWDLFLVLVIFILVVEAVVANRRAGREPDTYRRVVSRARRGAARGRMRPF